MVIAAAHGAHADAFIARLPNGFDTPIGEGGVRLSGGQRQRLAIARALVRDAPILLLDEPTAHLDPDAEAEVVAALDRLTRGRTMIVVAHRPRFAELVDRVVVLDGGRVVESGDPAELRRTIGPFARLLRAELAAAEPLA